MLKKRLFCLFTAGSMLALAGCAGLRTVSSEVSTYGEWPAGRKPGTYAFERLPSQQARATEAEVLESSARGALEKAGFKAVDAGQEPELLVQVGARDGLAAVQLWNDPLWWRGGFGVWRHGPWGGPRWGLGVSSRLDFPRYERQVALLIRDRASGKPLYEARAVSEGTTVGDATLMAAMFQAALTDFPQAGINPRRVDVALP